MVAQNGEILAAATALDIGTERPDRFVAAPSQHLADRAVRVDVRPEDRRLQVDEFDGQGRAVAHVEDFGLADRALDRQHVATTRAVRENGGRPPAVADGDPHPYGAEATTRSASTLTDLLGRLGRQADEEPALVPPGIPLPQLSIKGDYHEVSIARGGTPKPRIHPIHSGLLIRQSLSPRGTAECWLLGALDRVASIRAKASSSSLRVRDT